MTDAGKKALEELVAGIGRCEHDGGFDREIGPIGCMLGDKCVCAGAYPLASKALEEFATLEARATEAEGELSIIADHLESGAADSDAILHSIREIEADRDVFKERAAAAPVAMVCDGCGSHWSDERLEQERQKRPGLLSCCPERKMVPITTTAARKIGLEEAARWHDERASFCLSRRWSKKAAMHQISAAILRAKINEDAP